jgi:phosphoenolpyruvate carboxylase
MIKKTSLSKEDIKLATQYINELEDSDLKKRVSAA